MLAKVLKCAAIAPRVSAISLTAEVGQEIFNIFFQISSGNGEASECKCTQHHIVEKHKKDLPLYNANLQQTF